MIPDRLFCSAFVAVNLVAGLVWQAAATADIGALWQRTIVAALFMVFMARILERRFHARAQQER